MDDIPGKGSDGDTVLVFETWDTPFVHQEAADEQHGASGVKKSVDGSLGIVPVQYHGHNWSIAANWFLVRQSWTGELSSSYILR
jgi:hypothetical protein